VLRHAACENTERPAGDPGKEQDLDEASNQLGFLAPLGRGVEGKARDGEGFSTTSHDGRLPSPALRATSPQRGEEAKSRDTITIVVCSSCRDETGSDAHPRAGHVLGMATRDAASETGIQVREVECLGNCKRRLSAALLRDGCWSYVFGDLTIDSGPDLITGANLFAASTDGLIPWRGRPDSLKRGLVARIPPLAHLKDIA